MAIIAGACGKVANLSDQAGLGDAGYLPVNMVGGELAAIAVDQPYKEVIKIENGLSPFKFELIKGTLPPGIELEAATGVLHGNVSDSEVGKTFTVTFTVTDSKDVTDEQQFSIKVNPYSFDILPPELPIVIPSSAYEVKLTAPQAAFPLKFSISGSLPAGMTFDDKLGVLTSDPKVLSESVTSATEVPITIKASDKNDVEGSKEYVLKIAPIDFSPLSFSDRELDAATVGGAYREALIAVGGVAPYTFKITTGELPPGLVLDEGLGLLSGTIPEAEARRTQATFGVQVTDAFEQKAEKTFTFAIQPYAITITPQQVPKVAPTVAYALQFLALGAIEPVTFSLAGRLPENLEFSSTGALASVAPHVDQSDGEKEWPVEIVATDANGVTGRVSLTVITDVAPSNTAPLTIQSESLPTMFAGGSYSAGISVTGGVPPLTFSVLSGGLPSGLSLAASTGMITGDLAVATANDPYAVVIKVVDGIGQTQQKTYSGTVDAGSSILSIVSETLSRPIAGGEYSSVVAVTGGQQPYSFSVPAGTLPSGLSLNAATGVISGNVASGVAGNSYLFTVRVSDASGQTDDVNYMGTVGTASAPLAIQSTTIPTPVAGVSYSAGVSVTGGVAPLAFSLASGSLPVGLSLNAGSGIISGTVSIGAANGGFAAVVRVTDAVGQTDQETFSGTVSAGSSILTLQTSIVSQPIAGGQYSMAMGSTGGQTPYAYSIVSGSLPTGLSIDGATGLITGTVSAGLSGGAYLFSVRVQDAGGQYDTETFSGTIGAVSAPLTIQTTGFATMTAGTSFSSGVSVTGGISPFTFAITSGSLPTGLSLNTSTGVISGSLAYNTSGNSYAVTIRVTDSGGITDSETYTGTVQSGATTLTIATASITAPTGGSSYSSVIAVTGGVTPYAYSVSAGSLPTGLSINSSTGVISGSTAYGLAGSSYNFTVSVTDGSSQSASRAYSGTIASGVSALSVSTTSITTPTAGSAYLVAIAASGGVPPYTFAVSSGSLPSGMSLNTSTGVLSGTIALSARLASYVFAVEVTDSISSTASRSYAGTVSDYTMSLVPTSLPNATPGEYYTAALTAHSGQSAYTYAITSGALPSGLSLNTSTGVISGVVADAESGQTASFTARATDANGATVSRAYSLVTASFAVTLSTGALAGAVEGSAYSNGATALSASGGTGPYTYSYTGTMPSGVGLGSSGSFFGTPASGSGALSAGTTYSISIYVTDATGAVSQAYARTITVTVSVPSVTAGTLTSAVLGTPYSASLSASGGRPPYTYAISAGSAPTGISLSSAGALSGTPTVAGACPAGNFTVTVTDALSQTSAGATKCVEAVSGVSITNTSFPTVVIGTNYSGTISIAGGTGPYTYAATGLPSGVSLNAANGALSGFTNAVSGDYSVFLMVQDSSAVALTTARSFTFRVRDPLALASASLPRAAAAPSPGKAYAGATLAATGGVSPITYEVTSGALPSGLSLSSGGAISGTPAYDTAVSGSYAFTVTATDAVSQTVSQSFTIDVSVAPRIKNTALSPAVRGVAYAFDVERVGGVNTFSGAGVIASRLAWTASGLPAGLSIGLYSGRISGTTTAAANNYSVTITVEDEHGMTGSKVLTLPLLATGKTMDLDTARYSEPCAIANNTCDPRAFTVANLTNNAQKFLVYSNNLASPKQIQIARIDSHGRIPALSATTSSIAIPLTATNINIITDIEVEDLDQDGYKDIVFLEASSRIICSLWGSLSVDAIGMPSGYSSGTMTCWAIPHGFDTTNNIPYYMSIRTDLRPDATNYGKPDIIVNSASTAGGSGASLFILRNTCSVGGSCTATRATLFSGYAAAIVGTVTNASTTVTTTDTTGVTNGMPIIGNGIPAGVTVASFVVNTSITLSAAANASVTSARLSVLAGRSTAATATSGSATLTGVANTAGIIPGMAISGTNIPGGASVVSTTVNTIVMNLNATGSGAITALAAGASQHTPILGLAANSKLVAFYDFDIGYFNVAAPNPPTTYATSAATCPSIVVAGHQATNANIGYLYVMRQQYSGGECLGDFTQHTGTVADEQSIGTSTWSFVSGLAVADFNNDGYSDIAVSDGRQLANSAAIKTYLMPGGGTFSGATLLTSQMPLFNGVTTGASKIIPICLDGANSCAYPSLWAQCDRPYHQAKVANTASCMSILPNQCSTPGCLTAFETGTPTHRIDYPSQWGLNRSPVLTPLVSTSNLSITANTTSGSPTLSNIASTASVIVGQMISGSGVPANAYVTGKTASELTLSVNATATAAGVTMTLPVAPSLNDLVIMGTDSSLSSIPFFMVYRRNGASTTDPFRASRLLNGFPVSYLGMAEIGPVKLTDFNDDGKLDAAAYLVAQGAVATYTSETVASTDYSLGPLAPDYLSDPSAYGCAIGAPACLPDPALNSVGVEHAYAYTPGAFWHMSDTMALGDANNDGVEDVVTVGYESRGVSVALGSASGVLLSPTFYAAGSGADIRPTAVTVADLDQDGFVDIALTGVLVSTATSGYVSWLRGNGDGTFEDAEALSGLTSACTDLRAISAVDLDGDGRPELSFLCYTTQVIWIARRHTSGSWIAQTGGTINTAGGANGTVMRWGRLTSTNGMDLVVAGLDVNSSLRIINGVSINVTVPATGAFNVSASPGSYMSLRGYPADVAIGDINSDGYGDILTSTHSTNAGTTYMGRNFYTCESTAAALCTLKAWGVDGYQPTGVALGDVDGDGDLDAMVGYRGNGGGVTQFYYRTLGRTLNSSF